MICPKCNNEIPDNSTFCNHCGEKITPPEPELEQTSLVDNTPTDSEPQKDTDASYFKPKTGIFFIVLLAAVMVLGYRCTQKSSKDSSDATPTPTVESSDTDYNDQTYAFDSDDSDSSYDDYEDEYEDEETPKPTKTPKPVSAGCLNALDAAESYLDYDAFSKKGLIKQLKFEGYSSKEAKYAVNHVDVSWKEQAVKMAESYMDYSSFSKSGLIKQLRYEGFTKKQAEYGVKKAY